MARLQSCSHVVWPYFRVLFGLSLVCFVSYSDDMLAYRVILDHSGSPGSAWLSWTTQVVLDQRGCRGKGP